MSIEINGPQGRPSAEVADKRAPAASKDQETAQPASGSNTSTDTLSLTSEAAQLQALEDEIAALPVVDTQRVQEIQRSLAAGGYQIDPAQVAEKLLRFEAGMATD
jgi:negative regulator of flagellin synthesis FlgM